MDALQRDCRCAVVTDRGCRSAHGPAAGRLRNVTSRSSRPSKRGVSITLLHCATSARQAACKFGGFEGTVSPSCVGSHRITLLCHFGGASSMALRVLFSLARVGSQCRTLLSLVGGAHLRRERQARSFVLSLWVTYLPQRVRSVALRALFPFARVSLQPRTLLVLLVKLTFGARGRRALTCSHDWYDIFPKHSRIGGSEGTVSSSCVGLHRITLLGRFGGARRRRESIQDWWLRGHRFFFVCWLALHHTAWPLRFERSGGARGRHALTCSLFG